MFDEIFNNFEVRQSTLKVKVDSIENLCKNNFCLHENIDEIKKFVEISKYLLCEFTLKYQSTR